MTKQSEKQQDINPDQIIEELGGCGRFQIRTAIVIHLMKTVVCFGFSNLILSTATPLWYCVSDDVSIDFTSCTDSLNKSTELFCKKQMCNLINSTNCGNSVFDNGFNTLVSEFNLICDHDFIPSTINSIQSAGVLVGSVISGQLADLFGRKPSFFASILILMVTHIAGFFSTSWQMFAVCAFFGGMGGGFFLTVQYCLMSEFTLARWRAWVVGFPSWPIEGCIYALLGWLLHDWRKFQLMTAIVTVPCFFTWFIIPESFRWYIAHDKPEKAKVVLNELAKCNAIEDFSFDTFVWKEEERKDRKYTFLDLFKSRFLVKISLLLMVNWLAIGVISYGIAYGIQTLSGNIYLNFFLFSIFSIPSKGIAIWMQNRFGRRVSTVVCMTVVAISGIIVGVVQTLDISGKDDITNVFAIIANTAISTAWGPIQTMTIELYPTVIRNIGFGTLSLVGRIGAVAGPQFVYLNTFFPGLLFYVCGGIAVLCVLGTLFLPETKDGNLNDKITNDLKINE